MSWKAVASFLVKFAPVLVEAIMSERKAKRNAELKSKLVDLQKRKEAE